LSGGKGKQIKGPAAQPETLSGASSLQHRGHRPPRHQSAEKEERAQATAKRKEKKGKENNFTGKLNKFALERHQQSWRTEKKKSAGGASES